MISASAKPMHGKKQFRNSLFRTSSRAATAALAMAIALSLTVVLTPSAQAQTLKVIHNFTGAADGANPSAGLGIDKAGRLYGTAFSGGAGPCRNEYGRNGCGTVFELVRKGPGWLFNRLHPGH